MRVLLATDGSPVAQVAERFVESAPWPPETIVDVVRVVDAHHPRLPGAATARDDPAASAAAALDAITALAETLRARGIRADPVLLRGHAPVALVERIERSRPDLVVVGTRGLGPVGRVVLGSVSSAIVDHSPVPVLVVRRPALDRVIVATDGSDVADGAIATLIASPVLVRGEILVVSVAPGRPASVAPEALEGEPADAVDDSGSAELAAHARTASLAAERLAAAGVAAHPIVTTGHAGSAIRAIATAWDADLIVLGTHGRTGLSRIVLGSVARDVLLHASCSVLVVRRHAPAIRIAGRSALPSRSAVVSALV